MFTSITNSYAIRYQWHPYPSHDNSRYCQMSSWERIIGEEPKHLWLRTVDLFNEKPFLSDRAILSPSCLFHLYLGGWKGLNLWTVWGEEPAGHPVVRGRGHRSSQVLTGTFSEGSWGRLQGYGLSVRQPGFGGGGGGTRMPILFPLCFMKEGFHKMTVEPLWDILAYRSEADSRG